MSNVESCFGAGILNSASYSGPLSSLLGGADAFEVPPSTVNPKPKNMLGGGPED